ncbi:MAG: hypothetical protein ACLQVK_19280 [Acidimicrobiales bacterium]
MVRPPARRRQSRGADRPPPGLRELQALIDLAAGEEEGEVELRRISPSQARKPYLCPGCNHEIAPGTAHLVVVPRHAPDLRRHWHTPCWQLRDRRRPGH